MKVWSGSLNRSENRVALKFGAHFNNPQIVSICKLSTTAVEKRPYHKHLSPTTSVHWCSPSLETILVSFSDVLPITVKKRRKGGICTMIQASSFSASLISAFALSLAATLCGDGWVYFSFFVLFPGIAPSLLHLGLAILCSAWYKSRR